MEFERVVQSFSMWRAAAVVCGQPLPFHYPTKSLSDWIGPKKFRIYPRNAIITSIWTSQHNLPCCVTTSLFVILHNYNKAFRKWHHTPEVSASQWPTQFSGCNSALLVQSPEKSLGCAVSLCPKAPHRYFCFYCSCHLYVLLVFFVCTYHPKVHLYGFKQHRTEITSILVMRKYDISDL